MSVAPRGRIEGGVDLADWSASSGRGRSPSIPRRERRNMLPPADVAAGTAHLPADEERVLA